MVIKKDTLDQLLAGRDPREVFAKDGLVDELSLLVHPCLAGAEALGGAVPPWTTDRRADLDLISQEQYADGLVWLRYHVRHEGELP